MAEESFGAALREARTARGLSLAGLSRLVNYSRGYLSKVETGRSKPNPALARQCDEKLQTDGRLAQLVPPRPTEPPSGRRPPATQRPFDLPPAPAQLVGREDDAAALRGLLLGPRPGPGAARQVLVHGMAGVGKTALAVHVAHGVADAFPDGCLFLDFRSYGPDGGALTAGEALEIALRRLGLAGEAIPARVEDRSASFRSIVHGLRLLLVLDDVRRAQQVRPLVPAGAGCAVVITSRSRLVALDEADPIRLEPLGGPAGASLFTRVARLDPERVDRTAEESLVSIVASCGGLPLALRIAAANQRGSGDPYELTELADRLADGTRRLAELDDGERSTNAALAESCADLPADRRDLLALLALQPVPEFSGAAAAWLTGTEPEAARRRLHRLVDDNLLAIRHRDRFALHELTRTFAVQTLLSLVPVEERTVALRRLVTGYLASADAADRMLTPHRFRPEIDAHEGPAPPLAFPDAAAATAWFGTEQASLVAICRLAAGEGWSAACWQLAYAMRGYLFLAKAWDAWIQTHRVALDAARASGDRWAEAVTGSNLGLALVERGQLRSAQELYRRSMAIFRELGDKIGEAGTLGHQAWVAFCLGHIQSCYERASAALAIYEASGVRRNTAITLRTVALAESRLGRSADARLHLQQAFDLALELDLPLDAAMACNDLGYVLGESDLAAAERWYARGLQLSESCGSDYEQARAYEGLATVAAGMDRPRAAARFRQRALDRYETLNAPEAARLRPSAVVGSPAGPAPPRDGPDHAGGQS